jgi:hypothetical protein
VNAPPFRIRLEPEAKAVLKDLERPAYAVKLKKVKKTLRLLRDIGPGHPGLNSHKYTSMVGLHGEDVWESYVENKTPGAWRIFWTYGPGADELTIITVGPHP